MIALFFLGVALAAAGSRMEGVAARQQGTFEANLLRRDAAGARAEAKQHAEIIRRAGEKTAKAATAATAASGIDVNSQTAQETQREIYASSEQDALNTILTGEYRARSLEDQARLAKFRASNAEKGATISGASGAFQSVGTFMKGWKR
jgi:hypothetical protein